MLNRIVECVPNFSEGRRPEVIQAIVDAIRSAPGVYVLDVSSDPDHNRTVVTFVGSPETVDEGAFRGIAAAKELINLDEHRGEHPRIGATDVVPFVPVRNVTMQECVEIARRLGRRVGEELGIAVYLYAEAATRPERQRLANIRRGEYERWKEEIGVVPEREPDFGPAVPAPWGATVIGARPFLIAYNLYLNSDNVAIADRISRHVRHSSGGLRFVQAKGFLVEGQAQVSMNLTNFEKTPIPIVQELVKRDAAQWGLTVTHAELVGMIPQKALTDAAKWYLQLHDLPDDLILENKLAQVLEQEQQAGETESTASPRAAITPRAFLDAVAAPTPTPGGGSVAALAGALAAALTEMVAGLTVGRKKYAQVQDVAQAVLERAQSLRARLTQAIQEDAAAFDALLAAYRNKDLDESARREAIQAATRRAAEVPLEVARLSLEAARLALDIARVGNVNARSDAAVGALMAQAAVRGAGLNVRVNARELADRELAQAWEQELEGLESEVHSLAEEAVSLARGG